MQIYASKRELTPVQLLAAERLARAAGDFPDRDPAGGDLGGGKATDGFDPQAAWVDAREQFRKAWDEVPMSSRPGLQRVVMEGEPI